MRLIGDLVALLLALAAAAAGAGLLLARHADRPGPLPERAIVEIAPGETLGTIGRTLEERGIVGSSTLFELFVHLRGDAGSLRAGEYAMPAGIPLRAVVARLVEGATVPRRLTVPEGLTSAEIVALVAGGDGLVGAVAEVPAEGSLLPETYHYAKGDSRADMVARMQALARETLESLWRGRAPDLPFDTPGEAVVLASIVEKETGVAGERAHIAGVFVNRLRIGMPLQSDPTVIYAISVVEGPLGRPLRRSDLAYDSPYNTYVNVGLPPAAIANPGRAAIEAVLHPLDTEDLFFVADGT